MRSLIYRIGILFLCLTMLTQCAWTQTKEKRASLAGDWRFTLGDNMKYAKPEYDDSDWEKVYVPAAWQHEGFRNYNGYAWYRKKIQLDFSQKDALYLELGKIDDVDEVYVNGNFIGRTGGFPPDYFTAYNYPRRYHIPTEYLKPGKNVIAVRVYDEGGEGGIMGSSAALGIFNYPNYSDNSISLFGKWKFRLGDDVKWAGESVDDSDWEDVIVPASWESQGFEQYDGFAWYRKSFKVPANFNPDDLLLLMGRIDDLDEVFVNGKLVGRTGKIERKWAGDNEWQKYRTYTLPDGLIKPGKYNVIAVRVYDQQGVGGIYDGPITLLPQKEYKEFWRSYKMGRNSGESFAYWLSQLFE